MQHAPNTLPTILLVEDNQDDYEATLRSFQKSHALNPVYWCRNGQEALDYLASSETPLPGIMLLDLNMPGIDGKQVLTCVKANPLLSHIPVIVLTTSADHADIEKCYALGASSYIQKPVGFAGLLKAVEVMTEYWFNVALLPEQPPRASEC